jgi:hypothetical protein
MSPGNIGNHRRPQLQSRHEIRIDGDVVGLSLSGHFRADLRTCSAGFRTLFATFVMFGMLGAFFRTSVANLRAQCMKIFAVLRAAGIEPRTQCADVGAIAA